MTKQTAASRVRAVLALAKADDRKARAPAVQKDLLSQVYPGADLPRSSGAVGPSSLRDRFYDDIGATLTEAAHWKRIAEDRLTSANQQLFRARGYREALELALERLVIFEPGDSRAVSNEFVAMAVVASGKADAECMAIIRQAKLRPVVQQITYAHADGGRYVIVESGESKDRTTGEWYPSFSYRSVDGGMLFTTDSERWMARFKPEMPHG